MAPGFGGNHGSPYLYDRTVPLLVRSPGRVPAGEVRDEPIAFSSFSRTAAALLGVGAPAGDAGRDLTAR
jgi:arylsulfatase A-like enzyme